MKCPKCQAATVVVETRSPKRRRECINGHRFSTLEMALSEIQKLRGDSMRLTRFRLLLKEAQS